MISRARWPNITEIDAVAVNRFLPPVASLLLVVLVGWQIAKIIWILIPGGGASVSVLPTTSSIQSSSASRATTDYEAIAHAHIFGIADAAPDEPPSVVTSERDLADTQEANLTLNGTVASEIPNYSVAIISDAGKEQMVYTIGDSVGNNSTLHAVYADRVVLRSNGGLTNLKLPREFTDAAASSPRRSTASTRQNTADTKSIQSVVTQNLTKLTDVIRPTPYRVQGQQVGFRVYPGRDRRQFAALGLRPGDIIKDIDGQALSDASQAMQIFQSLGTAEQVTVTIERNGQSESLTLKTNQLDLSGEQNK